MYKTPGKGDNSSLIAEYQATRDIEIRNKIVMDNLPLVKTIALQMRGVYSKYADLEDILNQGIVTLMDCVERFDQEKNAKFETYASLRIRGAIIDFVRKQDWVPRRVRNSIKEIEDAASTLSHRLMREPSHKELAEYLGVTEDELAESISEGQASVVISFEGVLQDIQAYFLKTKEKDPDADPEGRVLKNELHSVLKQAIQSLTEKEQLVISLYYYDELKLSDIADVMGISQARACQLHTKAISKMQERLKSYMQGG